MVAWAICDTEGGRKPPRVLLKHLYKSSIRAHQARTQRGYNPEWYPVLRVRVEVVDG